MKLKSLLSIVLILSATKSQSSFFDFVKANTEVKPVPESHAKPENSFLSVEQIKDLREQFKPILEVPSKFLKFRSLWYEGNNRQQISNILMKEKIKKGDLQRLIELLNQEEKRLGYKATVIADSVNGVIMKKFLRELSHLMPEDQIEKEAKAKFINADQLVKAEKVRHRHLIQDKISPLIKTLPANSTVKK